MKCALTTSRCCLGTSLQTTATSIEQFASAVLSTSTQTPPCRSSSSVPHRRPHLRQRSSGRNSVSNEAGWTVLPAWRWTRSTWFSWRARVACGVSVVSKHVRPANTLWFICIDRATASPIGYSENYLLSNSGHWSVRSLVTGRWSSVVRLIVGWCTYVDTQSRSRQLSFLSLSLSLLTWPNTHSLYSVDFFLGAPSVARLSVAL